MIDWRFADGDLARLPGLAMDLVQSKPEVIVAAGQAAIRAVRNATSTIRVVMGGPGDPVAEGFIESLARPGANITGAATSAGDISSKRLELLLQAVPKVRRVALLLNPASRTHQVTLASMHIAAQMTKVVVVPVEARTSQEIEAAFVTIKREKVDAIAIQPDAIFNLHVHQIAELAMQQRLPSVAGIREYVDAGLLSGGPVRLHLEAVREIRLRAHSGNPRSRSHPLRTDIRSPM